MKSPMNREGWIAHLGTRGAATSIIDFKLGADVSRSRASSASRSATCNDSVSRPASCARAAAARAASSTSRASSSLARCSCVRKQRMDLCRSENVSGHAV